MGRKYIRKDRVGNELYPKTITEQVVNTYGKSQESINKETEKSLSNQNEINADIEKRLTRNTSDFSTLDNKVRGHIDWGDLSQSTRDLIDASGDGTIVNNPDNEDLTSVIENGKKVLKLSDRNDTFGMGYKVLRRGKSFASQVTQANTIYEIRYNFDLGNAGESTENPAFVIPNNCVLNIVGGLISNGTITGNNYCISNPAEEFVFNNLDIEGHPKMHNFTPKWCGAKGNGENDDTESVQYAIFLANKTQNDIYIKNDYLVKNAINYYKDQYNDCKNISILGDNEHGFKLDNNVVLFENSEFLGRIFYVRFKTVYKGYKYNNGLFKNCKTGNFDLMGCYITQFKFVFCDSDIIRLSKIHHNTIIASFFMKAEQKHNKLIDSLVAYNYISGSGDNVDNYFIDAITYNGSSIENNFIDYFRVLYAFNSLAEDGSMPTGWPNYDCIPYSHNNIYQVFRYFYPPLKWNNKNKMGGRGVISYNDTFQFNDPLYDGHPVALDRYKPFYQTNIDTNADYELPPYVGLISSALKCTIKEAIIEKQCNYVLFFESSPDYKDVTYIDFSFHRKNEPKYAINLAPIFKIQSILFNVESSISIRNIYKKYIDTEIPPLKIGLCPTPIGLPIMIKGGMTYISSYIIDSKNNKEKVGWVPTKQEYLTSPNKDSLQIYNGPKYPGQLVEILRTKEIARYDGEIYRYMNGNPTTFQDYGNHIQSVPEGVRDGTKYYDIQSNQPFFSKGSKWLDANGNPANYLKQGYTNQRTKGANDTCLFFDKQIHKLIWKYGTKNLEGGEVVDNWIDSDCNSADAKNEGNWDDARKLLSVADVNRGFKFFLRGHSNYPNGVFIFLVKETSGNYWIDGSGNKITDPT